MADPTKYLECKFNIILRTPSYTDLSFHIYFMREDPSSPDAEGNIFYQRVLKKQVKLRVDAGHLRSEVVRYVKRRMKEWYEAGEFGVVIDDYMCTLELD